MFAEPIDLISAPKSVVLYKSIKLAVAPPLNVKFCFTLTSSVIAVALFVPSKWVRKTVLLSPTICDVGTV